MAVSVYIDYGSISSISRTSETTVRVNIGIGVHASEGCRYWRATANGSQFASKEEQAGSTTLSGSVNLTVGPGAGTANVSVIAYGQPSQQSEGHSDAVRYSRSYPAQVYTVTFDPVEGTVIETSRSVDYGSAIGTLPTVTPPSGYAFLGWFTEQTGGTQINTTTVCYGNTTYYAQYKPMAILRMVNNGAVTTYTKIYSVGDGSAKQVLSVWSVDETGAHQGI